MQEIILDIINQFGYIGIFFLITLENIFPPIPSEIILTFGGFMTIHSELNVWGVIAAATAGSVFGAIILYWIGRILNTERLEDLLSGKLGKTLRLKKQDVRMAERWFSKHGKKAIFFGRFIPIIRSLISLPAGSANIKFRIFFLLTVLGTLIWNTTLVFLGRIAMEAWVKIAEYFDLYSMIVLILFIIIAGVIGAVFIRGRFLYKNREYSSD